MPDDAESEARNYLDRADDLLRYKWPGAKDAAAVAVVAMLLMLLEERLDQTKEQNE